MSDTDSNAAVVHEAISGRVTALESSFSSLEDSISRVESEAKEQAARLERKLDDQTVTLGAKIDRLALGNAAAQRTNWGTLASVGGVVLTVVGAFSFAMLGRYDERDRATEREVDRAAADAREARDLGIRSDERLNVLSRGGRLSAEGWGGGGAR